SLFGIPGAVPATRKGASDTVRRALVAQIESVRDEASRRQGDAARLHDELQQQIDKLRATNPNADVDDATKVDSAVAITEAVFGRGAMFLPTFRPPASAELGRALTGGPASVAPTSSARSRVLRKWAQQIGRVRPPMARWRRLS